MGTNYYLYEKPACKCCGREFDGQHIGKSSGGWCFALHVVPEDSIHTLDDWRALWSRPGSYIRNEYGNLVSIEDMEDTITNREWRGDFPRRHDIDGRHCLGHGPGTWDYITGEFS